MEARNFGTSSIGSTINQALQVPPAFDPDVQPTTPIPTDRNSSTFTRNFGKLERIGSTFSWKIFRPGREKLLGYSKPKEMAEKANKQELLMDCIRRLANKGYIKEGLRVEFYRNFSDDDNDSVKLMTLYGTRFIPEPVVITQEWLMKFLKNLYNPVVYNYGNELFPTGGKPAPPEGTAIIPDSAKQAPAKDPFDLSRTFKTEDALHKYVEKLIREGHPNGRVEDYYRQKIQSFHTRHFS